MHVCVVCAEESACRVCDLKEPEKKMSKSALKDNACLYLDDTDDEILTKLKVATTDCHGIKLSYDPELRPGVSNLLTLHSAFSGMSYDEIIASSEGKNTIQFKREVADHIIEHVRPIRQRLEALRADQGYVDQIVTEGTERAQQEASDMWSKVRTLVGLP